MSILNSASAYENMQLKVTRADLTASVTLIANNNPRTCIGLKLSSRFSCECKTTTTLKLNLSAIEGLYLYPDSTYTITINDGVLKDASHRYFSNPSQDVAFSTNSRPILSNRYPNFLSASENAYFEFTFNRRTYIRSTAIIKLYQIKPTGDVLLKSWFDGDILVGSNRLHNSSINWDSWKLDVRGLIAEDGEYFITIDENSFADYDNFGNIEVPANSWQFTIQGGSEFPGLISLLASLGSIYAKLGCIRRYQSSISSSTAVMAKPVGKVTYIAHLNAAATSHVINYRVRKSGSSMSSINTLNCINNRTRKSAVSLSVISSMNITALDLDFAEVTINSQFAMSINVVEIALVAQSSIGIQVFDQFSSTIRFRNALIANNNTSAVVTDGPRYKMYYDYASSFTSPNTNYGTITGNYGIRILQNNSNVIKFDLSSGQFVETIYYTTYKLKLASNSSQMFILRTSNLNENNYIDSINLSSNNLEYTIGPIDVQTSGYSNMNISANNDYIGVSRYNVSSYLGDVSIYDPTDGSFLTSFTNPNTSGTYDRYGSSIDLLDNYLIVGAPDASNTSYGTGKVYLYNLTSGLLEHTFTNPSISSVTGAFGGKVKINNSHIVIDSLNQIHIYDRLTNSLVYNFTKSVGVQSSLSSINDTYFAISRTSSPYYKIYNILSGAFVSDLLMAPNSLSMSNNYIFGVGVNSYTTSEEYPFCYVYYF